MVTLIKPLLVNITILFSFTFNGNLFFPFQTKTPLTLKQKLIYGLLGSFGALLCMFYPIETLGETHFDLRMVAIMIVTLYAGWLPGSIVLASVVITRYLIGGQFINIGILVSVLAFIVSFALRRIFLDSKHRVFAGTLIALLYFYLYISILASAVIFLDTFFYLVYFIAFYITFISLIFVIENLFRINKQINEMMYVDKLTMVGQLAASIAHEIRNPLSTVRGFIQYLSQDSSDENLKKFSPLILEELDRTNSIITNYLKVSKPEKFHLSNVPMHEVIQDCVLLMRPLASYSNVVIDYDDSGPFYVQGDEHHLKQAIMNVIKNAIESIPEQGYVKIRTLPDYFKSAVEVKIEDNGRGMTPEQLKHIGLPFYTTKTKGTGLGSMVTNKIIREMEGSIEYESTVGKGTTVRIVLPLLKTEA
ncbi:ATP-binding protein [Bacillus sp. ISL-47]|uniref:ATP-binding protein n=1 Tax=Bacillus sp. ISL-47 TaxID=2819130 RepID=UPI001BED22A2|nr:ATP-binding protein [Bacillus sp. ISL-47]MBT2687646.1 ATP-binding protein [Bacillus sp. ISL-47]MBT2710703.1 ATP-binding protein [Pseudomonas sp. ISL-84]